MKRSLICMGAAVAMAMLLPFCALLAPGILKALFWKLGSDPAVAVLQGEYWGAVVRVVLLTVGPLVPVACFLAERISIRRARRRLERREPGEFSTQAPLPKKSASEGILESAVAFLNVI